MVAIRVDVDKTVRSKTQYNNFREIHNYFQERLYNLVVKIVHDREHAKDIVQESLMAVYLNIETFRSDSSLATWIIDITRNKAIDYLRKEKREVETSNIDDLKDPQFYHNQNPERIVSYMEMEGILSEAVEDLDNGLKIPLELRARGFSEIEIARHLGISPGNVRIKIFRARKKLRENKSVGGIYYKIKIN